MYPLSIPIEKKHISGLIQSDWNSFKELYILYKPLLMAFVFRHLKNREDSEEIVQDVFARVWEQRQNINADLSFKSFLFTITKNKIIDYFRKVKTENLYTNYIANYIEIIQDTTNSNIASKEINQSLSKAISLLPEKRKTVFLLSKKFNLSRNEIAQFLNISENTVKNHLQEAIQFLRENLKDEVVLLFLFIYKQLL
jgi:RNA polymerase sigma-70 factor (ECF subfamily)